MNVPKKGKEQETGGAGDKGIYSRRKGAARFGRMFDKSTNQIEALLSLIL